MQREILLGLSDRLLPARFGSHDWELLSSLFPYYESEVSARRRAARRLAEGGFVDLRHQRDDAMYTAPDGEDVQTRRIWIALRLPLVRRAADMEDRDNGELWGHFEGLETALHELWALREVRDFRLAPHDDWADEWGPAHERIRTRTSFHTAALSNLRTHGSDFDWRWTFSRYLAHMQAVRRDEGTGGVIYREQVGEPPIATLTAIRSWGPEIQIHRKRKAGPPRP